METVIVLMMLLVCFSFVLKQTFHGVREVMAVSVIVMVFTAMMCPFAIEQSKTQMASWLADTSLMLDVAVLLSVDVALTLLFCVAHVDLKTSAHVSRGKWMVFIGLKYFPGLLIFPVLFSGLTAVIFLLPGVSFQLVAWTLGGLLLPAVPLLVYGLRRLLPEREIRLEMLFLGNILLALMGVIATVNGRTAVVGFDSFDWRMLLLVVCVVTTGAVVGWVNYLVRMKKLKNKIEGKR